MVHQNTHLVEPHPVWENIILGKENSLLLNKKRACAEIQKISAEFGMQVDPEAFVWQLSVGEKQRLEIVKALFHGAKILILDEPMSVLTPQESQNLFQTLRKMVEKGLSIIFISHKLREVMSISDRVVVLRQGENVKEVKTADTNQEELASLMMGGGVVAEIET